MGLHFSDQIVPAGGQKHGPDLWAGLLSMNSRHNLLHTVRHAHLVAHLPTLPRDVDLCTESGRIL